MSALHGKNGGPAFPVQRGRTIDGSEDYADAHFPGMSLRDYFAGQALPAYIARGYSRDSATQYAYLDADAMLKAREEQQP